MPVPYYLLSPRTRDRLEQAELGALFAQDESSDSLRQDWLDSPSLESEILTAHEAFTALAEETTDLRPTSQPASTPQKVAPPNPEFTPPPVPSAADDLEEQMADEPVDPLPIFDEDDAAVAANVDRFTETAEEVFEKEEVADEEKDAVDAPAAGTSGQPTKIRGKPKLQLLPDVQAKLDEAQKLADRGEVPAETVNKGRYVEGFLLKLFRGLLWYIDILIKDLVLPCTNYRVIHLLATMPLHDVLSHIAGRFLGNRSQQKGYLAAAADPSLHFREVFHPMFYTDKSRVLYGRAGFCSAHLGGNVIATRPDQFNRYCGVAYGELGLNGRGYQRASYQTYPPRQFQSLAWFGSPGAPNDFELPAEPSVKTYRIANLGAWSKAVPEQKALADILEGVASIDLGGIGEWALFGKQFKEKYGRSISPHDGKTDTVGLQRSMPGTFDFQFFPSSFKPLADENKMTRRDRRHNRNEAWLDNSFGAPGMTLPTAYYTQQDGFTYPQAYFHPMPGAAAGRVDVRPSNRLLVAELHPSFIKFNLDPNPASSNPVTFSTDPRIERELLNISPSYTVNSQIGAQAINSLTNFRKNLMIRFSDAKYRDMAVSKAYVMPWTRFELNKAAEEKAARAASSKGKAPEQGASASPQEGESNGEEDDSEDESPGVVNEIWPTGLVVGSERKRNTTYPRARLVPTGLSVGKNIRWFVPDNFSPAAGPAWTIGSKFKGHVYTSPPYALHVGPKDRSSPIVFVGNLNTMITGQKARQTLLATMARCRAGN